MIHVDRAGVRPLKALGFVVETEPGSATVCAKCSGGVGVMAAWRRAIRLSPYRLDKAA
jgi:hypothetical protein